MNDSDGRMSDSIEGICLHCGVVKHIFEDDIFTNLQFMIEFPEAHEVTTKATIATNSIYMLPLRSLHRVINLQGFGISHGWHVWHFETIRHVTGKTCIDNCSFYTLILYHIYYLGNQRTRLPPKSTARLHDNLEMRITGMKSL